MLWFGTQFKFVLNFVWNWHSQFGWFSTDDSADIGNQRWLKYNSRNIRFIGNCRIRLDSRKKTNSTWKNGQCFNWIHFPLYYKYIYVRKLQYWICSVTNWWWLLTTQKRKFACIFHRHTYCSISKNRSLFSLVPSHIVCV